MPRQLHWSELTAGMVAAAVITALVLVVLFFARVGALHGKKVTLYVVTDDATGVLSGTEVWLGGVKEGVVKDVSFREPSADTSERVIVTAEFLNKALPGVRRDSYAQIRPGGSLIGAVIVYIAPGSATSPPLHDGDTVHARQQGAIANLTEDLGTIAPAFSDLVTQVKELNAKTSSPAGTIGSFRAHGSLQMTDVGARISRISAKAATGNGTVALANSTNLVGRASRVMAAADSIRALLGSNKGSIGRFRRDTTLVTKARGVLAELDTLRAFVSNPVGTIAASHSDSALTQRLNQSHAELDSLVKNIKSHPTRYIKF
jgi:phospholipid/cholesterol/gamma-HCH transport system substrate-binding protein